MHPSAPSQQWVLLTGQLVAAAVVSLVGTWPVSLLLLAAYRRRIARSMREASFQPPVAVVGRPITHSLVPAPPVRVVPVLARSTGSLEVQARRAVLRAQLIFGGAGVAFGVTTLVVLLGVGDVEFLPVRALTVALVFSWPAVPAVLAQRPAAPPWTKVLAWAAYVVAVLGLPVLAGLPLGQAVLLAVLSVGISAVWAVATGARFVKGAAWFVAPALVALALVALQWYVVLLYLQVGVRLDATALAHFGTGVLCVGLLGGYTVGLVWAWRSKLVGDQTLLVMQWWSVATMGIALDLGSVYGPAGLLGLAPLLVAAVVVVGGNVLVPLHHEAPRRLLLLRTFGFRARSTRLLRRLTQEWRWIGSIQLIAAPDSAVETVGPGDFVDFLLGRLRRRLVTDPAALARRLLEVDLRPDRDGRYRVTDFLCTATMWQPTVQRLIDDADVILVDLREFDAQNAGVAYELERLVDSGDLGRVVGLVDASTDLTALDGALAVAAQRSSPNAPVRNGGLPLLRTVVDSEARPAQLLAALNAAVPPEVSSRLRNGMGT